MISTSDATMSKQIQILLNAQDDDAELKTGATKNKYGIYETNSKNFNDDVKNSKGTVYVIMGSVSGCSHCRNLEQAIKKRLSEVEAVATVYSIEWDDNSKLCWNIFNKGNTQNVKATFPQIAKFVDGQFVELISDPRDSKKAVQRMINKAKSSTNTATTSSTNTTVTTASTATTTSTATTKATENSSEGEYTKLKAQLDKLNEEISGIDTQLTALKTENTNLEKEKAELDEEQATKQNAANEASQKLQEEQETLANYIKKYEEIQEEVKKLNEEILSEQKKEEQNYKDSIETITNNAINNYDSTKDGDDFDAYLQKQLSDNGYPIFSNLDYLNSQAEGLSDDAKGILKNINSQTAIVHSAKVKADIANNALTDVTSRVKTVADKINTNNTTITGLEATKATKETEKTEVNKKIQELIPGAGLTGTEVLAKISECEKNCAKELGWNLEDCVVAMGEDGAFHIYPCKDKNVSPIWENGGYVASAVRTYYQQTKVGLDSTDYNSGEYCSESLSLIPQGSGWISTLNEASEGSGRAVYTFSSVNDCWSEGEACCNACCYCTASPLSFDVNGDGVKTTEETVSFDIDGDGKLDTVNNSAEWVLAFDKDGNGKAGENGSELFGDNTDLDGDGKADGYSDGFAALKALALKEGLISATDSILDTDDIKKLSEKYGLVMTDGYGGESKSLADLGITEINLAQTTDTTLTKNFDGRNNDIMTQEGATFVVNGETREYADIWNAKKDSSEAAIKDNDDEYVVKQATVKEADIKSTDNKKLKLTLNNDRVVALQGKVEYKNIEKLIAANAGMPDEILNEIIEVDDDEE